MPNSAAHANALADLRPSLPPLPFLAAPGYGATDAWVAALQAAMPDERIVPFSALSPADQAAVTVAIVANPDPAELAACPNLVWLHSVWAGVERLLAEMQDSQVHIVRLVDPRLAATMAEAVLAWVLYLHRDMPRYLQQQKEQRWQPQAYRPAAQRRIGLLGLGALGEAAARSLQQAGFPVLGWSRTQKHLDGVDCYSGEAGLSAMLAQTDILVCLLPLTAATTGLINAQRLAMLPAGASLINFARGPIVVEQDLRAALDAAHLQHAVLDVFAVEPLPPDSWQWTHPAVTVLPHCSAPTDKESAAQIVAGNLKRYREQGLLPKGVDRQQAY